MKEEKEKIKEIFDKFEDDGDNTQQLICSSNKFYDNYKKLKSSILKELEELKRLKTNYKNVEEQHTKLFKRNQELENKLKKKDKEWTEKINDMIKMLKNTKQDLIPVYMVLKDLERLKEWKKQENNGDVNG